MSTVYKQVRWLSLLAILMLVLAACGGQVIEETAPDADNSGEEAAVADAADAEAAKRAAE